MKTSNFLSLNWLDLGKGFLVGFIAFALDFLQNILIPSLDISPEVKVMILAAIGYLVKNFFTAPKKVDASVEDIGAPFPPKR